MVILGTASDNASLNQVDIGTASAPDHSPLTLIKTTLHAPSGLGHAVLSLILIAACGVTAAAEPLNFFERLGQAISRATSRPERADSSDASLSAAGASTQRYQATDKDGRPALRISPAGQTRYGDAERSRSTAPKRFNQAKALSSLRFQPSSVPIPTRPELTPVNMPLPSPASSNTSYYPRTPVPPSLADPRESVRLPLDPLAIVSAPKVTTQIAAASTPPQASATTVPRPIIPFAILLKYGRVKMSFPPYSELDVEGLASGSLAKDPTSGKIFRVP